MKLFHLVLAATLGGAVHAASLPDQLALIMPTNGSRAYADLKPTFGFDSSNLAGSQLDANVSFVVTRPDGQQADMQAWSATPKAGDRNGTRFAGCTTNGGGPTWFYIRDNSLTGVYRIVTNATFGTPSGPNCTMPLTYQSFYLTNYFELLPPSTTTPLTSVPSASASASSTGILPISLQNTIDRLTTTQKFASAPTGTWIPNSANTFKSGAGTLFNFATLTLALGLTSGASLLVW